MEFKSKIILKLYFFRDNKFVNKTINKDELHQQINDAALCCKIMETMLKTGPNLWSVPKHLAKQAKDAQKRALDRKDMSKDKKNVRDLYWDLIFHRRN